MNINPPSAGGCKTMAKILVSALTFVAGALALGAALYAFGAARPDARGDMAWPAAGSTVAELVINIGKGNPP